MLGSTQLIQHLKLLQKEELKTVKNFVKLHSSKRQKHLPLLLGQLLYFFPDYDFSSEDEKKIIRKLIPGTRYEKAKGKLVRWCHDLLTLVKAFLVQLHLQNNQDVQRNLLRTIYLERGQIPLYQFELKHQLDKLLKDKLWSSYYELQYQASTEQLSSPLIDGYEYQNPSIEDAIEALELTFSWQRMQLELDELNRTQIYTDKEGTDRPFATLAREFFASRDTSSNAAIIAYRLVRMALTESEKKHTSIQTASSYLKDQIRQLSKTDAGLLIRQLINIFNRQLKSGQLVYLEETLELYKLGLQQEVFINKGKLPVRLFINIATIGDAAGKYEWVHNFLTTYENQVGSSYQQIGKNLAWAGHFFHQGSTKNDVNMLLYAHKKLPHQHQLPVWFSLRRYSLDVRLQLELFLHNPSADSEHVEFAVQRFSKYLQRNETLNEKTIALYLRGLQCIRTLLKYELLNRMMYTKEDDKAVLATEIKTQIGQSQLPWKPWFIKKAEDMLH